MKSAKKLTLGIASIMLLGGSSIYAATATYSVFDIGTAGDGESDILNDGTYVLGANYGDNDSWSINGVQFDGVRESATAGVAEITKNGVTATLTLGFENENVNGIAPSQYSTALQDVFDSNMMTNQGGGGFAGTFSLSGLTVGTAYRLQILGAYQAGQDANRGFRISDGTNSADVVSDGVTGKSVVVVWTADATSQSFDLERLPDMSSRVMINGASLAVIPEPGTFALLAGSLALAFVAAKRRRS